MNTADLRTHLREQDALALNAAGKPRLERFASPQALEMIQPIPLDPSKAWNFCEIGGGGTGLYGQPVNMQNWSTRPNLWRENKIQNVIISRAHGITPGRNGYYMDEFLVARDDPDRRPILFDGFIHSVGGWLSEDSDRRLIYYTGGDFQWGIFHSLCAWLSRMGKDRVEIAFDVGAKMTDKQWSQARLIADHCHIRKLWLEPFPRVGKPQYGKPGHSAVMHDRMMRVFQNNRHEYTHYSLIEETLVNMTGHDREHTLEQDMQYAQQLVGAWQGINIGWPDWQHDEWAGRCFEIGGRDGK